SNLLRLEDLKSELAPRLEALRTQAAAAREAADAGARLELLRGSIVWEEWREARDAHRRASSQVQGLERKLIEAREQARIAEDEFGEAEKAIDPAAEIPSPPDEPDTAPAHEAQRTAEQARRAAALAASSVAALRTRREFLEEQSVQAARAVAAASTLADVETSAALAQERAKQAEQAVVALARLQAELGGIDAARPPSGHGL